jgi:serine/threonine-protein kinase PknK
MFDAIPHLPPNSALNTIIAGRHTVQKSGPDAWREAWMQSRAAHWAVVPIETIGATDDGAPALVSPKRLIDLAALLTLKGPLHITSAWTLIKNLAEARAHIHAIGMIHGDIAPSNLLWSPETEWQLTDFGLARWRSAPARTIPAGQYEFMAPETLDSGETTSASDIYGFGATAWAALTGDAPPAFGGALPDETPVDLMFLVEQCLSDTPAERPKDGSVIAETLAQMEVRGQWMQ